VPSRSGTTAAGTICPVGYSRWLVAAITARSPAHTRIRGLNFYLTRLG
jgi:hypothetical protein